MLIPSQVMEEVSKKEDNLGYYVNLGNNNIPRVDYAERTWNKTYYKGYRVDLYSIPTGILKLIVKSWTSLENNIIKDLADEQIEELVKIKKELTAFVKTLTNVKMRKAKNLDDALTLLQGYFRTNLNDNGWIYRKDYKNNRHYPFTVTRIQIEEDKYDRRRRWISIEMINNTRNESKVITETIDPPTLKEHKNSIVDVIRANNMFFETEELKQEYKDYIEDYYEKEVMQNHQFIDNEKIKYINDNVFEKGENLGRWNKKLKLFTSSALVQHADNCPIPFEPLIYTFNLNKHDFEWKDTRDLEVYEYDKKIVDKLILPKEHKGLIDILTNDFIQDNGSDIIQGKSGGTIILCKGKAGLGKTLTAEIYSELKEKPLYSVHSGQLGTNGTKIEETLKEAFGRAERWGAILLIDEADVYIRERDNDTNHNAIVASFLRVMEYYNGLMFMTTNREKDIDDAILSRCMSVLTYRHPEDEVKEQLWSIYLKQFNIEFNDELIVLLNEEFKEISGRDIKNVSRLVSRFIQGYKLEKATIKTFIDCAVFRGIREVTSK